MVGGCIIALKNRYNALFLRTNWIVLYWEERVEHTAGKRALHQIIWFFIIPIASAVGYMFYIPVSIRKINESVMNISTSKHVRAVG